MMDDGEFGRLCERLHAAVRGALLSSIDAHGPITKHNLGSAEKRVKGAIRQSLRDLREVGSSS